MNLEVLRESIVWTPLREGFCEYRVSEVNYNIDYCRISPINTNSCKAGLHNERILGLWRRVVFDTIRPANRTVLEGCC